MNQINRISIIVIDALRYDCINYHPDKKFLVRDKIQHLLETPTLDKLSKESVFFTTCYSTTSLTTPSVSSMLTGTNQRKHGIQNTDHNVNAKMNKNIYTLATILKSMGFLTVFCADVLYLFRTQEITRGFDYVFKGIDKKLFEFLEQNKNKKIFLFCDFEDVHVPYMYSPVPPEPNYNDDFFETMQSIFKKYKIPVTSDIKPIKYWKILYNIDNSRDLWFPLYVKGVSKFDKGRFKFFINEMENHGFLDPKKAIACITSDHGQGKRSSSEPKLFQQGGQAFEEIARVPLIIKHPLYSKQINDDLVSNIDIFKIILDSFPEEKNKIGINYSLDSVNPFIEKRDFASFVFYQSNRKDKTKLPADLSYRAILTKEKKYSVFGNPESFLEKNMFELENSEFILQLYIKLLVRLPSEKEKLDAENKLKTGWTKEKLYDWFVNSSKYQEKYPFVIYDLKTDPFEEYPYRPGRDFKSLFEFGKYLNDIMNLQRLNENDSFLDDLTPDGFVSSQTEIDEEKELRAELEKMGYV